jgi:hypothetical protein
VKPPPATRQISIFLSGVLGVDVGGDVFEGAPAPGAHCWAAVDVVPDRTQSLLKGPGPPTVLSASIFRTSLLITDRVPMIVDVKPTSRLSKPRKWCRRSPRHVQRSKTADGCMRDGASRTTLGCETLGSSPDSGAHPFRSVSTGGASPYRP